LLDCQKALININAHVLCADAGIFLSKHHRRLKPSWG